MKVSREQCAENRQRILDVAGKLFREKGFDGIGVADIMKGAGLTHGGFYGHFASKDDLIAEACARVMSGSVNSWAQIVEQRHDDAAAAIVDGYLSTKHRDRPGTGCLFAALGPDVARQGKPIRRVFTEGVRARLEKGPSDDVRAGGGNDTRPCRRRSLFVRGDSRGCCGGNRRTGLGQHLARQERRAEITEAPWPRERLQERCHR